MWHRGWNGLRKFQRTRQWRIQSQRHRINRSAKCLHNTCQSPRYSPKHELQRTWKTLFPDNVAKDPAHLRTETKINIKEYSQLCRQKFSDLNQYENTWNFFTASAKHSIAQWTWSLLRVFSHIVKILGRFCISRRWTNGIGIFLWRFFLFQREEESGLRNQVGQENVVLVHYALLWLYRRSIGWILFRSYLFLEGNRKRTPPSCCCTRTCQ